jgi:hypothetical protein
MIPNPETKPAGEVLRPSKALTGHGKPGRPVCAPGPLPLSL